VNLRVITGSPGEEDADGLDLAALLDGLREGLAGRALNLFCDVAVPGYDPFAHKKGGDTDAFVMAPGTLEEELLDRIGQRRVPAVMVNAVRADCYCVAPDHHEGLDRLLGQLAERIEKIHPCLLLSEPSGRWNEELRAAAEGACVRRGLLFDPARDALTSAGAREAAATVATSCPARGWNAIVCDRFSTAVAVLGELGRVGIAGSGRVTVACIGDAAIRRLMRPAPVALAVPDREIGRRAGLCIERWLDGEEWQPGVERVAGSLSGFEPVARSGS
jgi:DNA-binding LacI/PurR family transcriptional regulator